MRFLASELKFREASDCRFHIIPVPFEATVSYGGGTAEGPAAILEASQQLELWNGRGIPTQSGVFTWPAVGCRGNSEEVLNRIEAATHAALDAGPQGPLPQADRSGARCVPASCMPIILGGEHSVTLGVLRALKQRYGTFGIVQFDAHADLRASYQGSPYSHASVMHRAVDDLNLPLVQIGVRSLCTEEEEYRNAKNITRFDAREACFPLAHRDLSQCLRLPEHFPDNVYVTFDVDAFDASLMPSTGTPEPGGLFWWDALRCIEYCLAGRVCLGYDVVELAPLPGLHAPNYTAARLVHEIMGIAAGL